MLSVSNTVQPAQLCALVSADNSPNVASSPLNVADSTGSNPSMNPGKEAHFVPDFTLFCTEKTIYMKVTRKLYATAIRTTEIEKQRTNSMNKSLSGVAIGSDDFEAKTNPESLTLLPRERKASQYMLDVNRFRKISMSTNLPDSSLFHDHARHETNNAGSEDDKLVVSYFNQQKGQDTSKPPVHPASQKDILKHSKTAPTESLLKRSDAVDLLMDDLSDKTPTGGQIKMNSLSKDIDPYENEGSETNQKAGNGSLKFVADKTTGSEQKTTDLDDHDETSHLI